MTSGKSQVHKLVADGAENHYEPILCGITCLILVICLFVHETSQQSK